MLTGVDRLRESNTAGACKLMLVRWDDVLAVPDPIAGNISSAITLIPDASWITLVFTLYTQHLTEDWDDLSGRQVSRARVSGVIPKDRLSLMPELWDMKPHRYLALNFDRNGTVKLMGTKEEPAMVRVLGLDHGADPRNPGERNQAELLVSCTRRTPCPFYLATPPSSIPAGCPTLAELLAPETGAAIWALLDGTQQAAVLAAAGVLSFSGIDDQGPTYTNSLVEP